MCARVTERVHLVSLGCARNDVDSEELLARLEQGGFELTDDPETASAAIVVNTCGFIESAKKDSVDTLLPAADYKLARQLRRPWSRWAAWLERGRELADALPEAPTRCWASTPTPISPSSFAGSW